MVSAKTVQLTEVIFMGTDSSKISEPKSFISYCNCWFRSGRPPN
jgi:hypothetical protein